MTEQRIRPRFSRKDLNRAIAEELYPEITAWLKDDNDDKEWSITQLVGALSYADDGYEVAKRLEDEGWAPDAELVDILSNARDLRYTIAQKKEEEWVSSNGFKPLYAENEIVKIDSPKSRRHGDIGVISIVYPKTLKYAVSLTDNPARADILDEEEIRYLTPGEISRAHAQKH